MELELLDKNIVSYNASVRNILADKNYLSYLLQNLVTNYKDLDRKTIESLIGEINTNDEVYKLYGLSNDDTSFLDGSIKYDLLFTTKLPNSNDKIGMLINLELQSEGKDTDLKRMIYYCSKMLVSEKNRIFKKDEYKDIVKVCAIWIVVQNKKDQKNSVNIYSFQENKVIGNYHASIDCFDLMEIVTLYLGDQLNGSILDPINILFKSKLQPEKIFEILEDKYDINFHMETKAEVKSMCDLGQGIYKQGIEQGIQKGIEQGELKLIIKLVEKKIKSGLTVLEALNDLGVEEMYHSKYLKALKERV